MSALKQFLVPLIKQTDFKVLPLAGDASTRKYSRIVSENEQSWVLMEWEAFDETQDFPFLSVLNFFNKNGIKVPNLIGLDSKHGYFLLEDLGDLTLERKFWEFNDQKNILPYYKQVLDELISIHSIVFADQKYKTTDCTAFSQSFDTDKLLWEFNYTHKHLLKTHWNNSLCPEQEQSLQTIYMDISQKLASQPKVICHRDFHSRNVMLKKGQAVLIDFQDARLGPAVYDLVSLLWDSYVDLKPEIQQDLLLYYCNRFPYFSQIAGSKGEFMENLNLQIIQRCYKACGSFSSFKNTRNDERYLKYIPGTLEQISELLKDYPDYKALLDILVDNKAQWK